MTYESVLLFILDATPEATPIPNVLVKVFDSSGLAAFTEVTTDDTGMGVALLPAPATYQVRCYKQQVAFHRPVLMDVLSQPIPPQTNSFNIRGETFIPPTSKDLRLCLVSGFFRRPDGSPAANVDIHLIARFDPILLEGSAVLTERVEVRTNRDGYVQVALIRNGKYDLTVQGFEDVTRTIIVPDQGTANIPDVMFPVVSTIVFDVPGPYLLTVGQDFPLMPTVITTSGVVLEQVALGDLFWRSSDSNVLGILIAGGILTLRGIGVGSASLQATRADSTIIRIPNTPIQGVPLAVTVH